MKGCLSKDSGTLDKFGPTGGVGEVIEENVAVGEFEDDGEAFFFPDDAERVEGLGMEDEERRSSEGIEDQAGL